MKRKHRTVLKFAANLTWLFTEVDFLDRFAAAADVGFKGVEFLFPYDFKASEVTRRLIENNQQAVLINAPPGDWGAGDRGLGCLAGRQSEFRDSIKRALDYADSINCPKIHIMAGIAGADAKDRFIDNLHHAAEACDEAGMQGLIEPINDIDMPGYFLTLPSQAMEILSAVGSPNLGLQLDLYHAARMGCVPGDAIENCIGVIGHFQIAGVPARLEPDIGDVDFTTLLDKINILGYEGWVGCEYRPRTTTLEGLDWVSEYL